MSMAGAGEPENVTPPPSYWTKAPVDPAFRAWCTVGFQRLVLCVVRTTTTLARLLDVVSLVESDLRVQVVFTTDPEARAALSAGVTEALAALGVPVVPWDQAVRSGFDLVIAASENDRTYVFDAPVLLVPHGLGFQKYYPDRRTVAGLSPDRLLRNGPTAIALSHPEQSSHLTPEAAEKARTVGDPTVDRMLLSRHRIARYRSALQADHRKVVLLCSTWGRHSLFGSWPQLPLDLLAALPADEYRVVLSMHPGVFAAHGVHQVRAWLSKARRHGLALLPPHEGWRSAVLAADVVVGDEGSPMLAATAVRRPVLFAAQNSPTTVPGSPLAGLSAAAAPLGRRHDLREQIDRAIAAGAPDEHGDIAARAVAARGDSARLFGEMLYDLLRLPAPDDPEFAPLPDPCPDLTPTPVHVVGAAVSGSTVRIHRYPAVGERHEQLALRHVAADATEATLREVSSANVLYTRVTEDVPAWARQTLAEWPVAHVAAGLVDDRTCLALNRDSVTVRVTASGDVCPSVLASVAYARPHPGDVRLMLGGRSVDVQIRAESDSGRSGTR